MDGSHLVSGIGHAGLISWMLFGGLFAPAPDPVEVTEVAVISGAEFDALLSGTQAPEIVTDVALPAAPEVTPEEPEVAATPEVDTAPEQPAALNTPEPEVQPDPVEDPVDPNVSDTAPESMDAPAEVTVLVPDVSDTDPVERPADRVAPQPVAQPDPDVAPDAQTETAALPQPTQDPVVEEQAETAEPEATDRIVTEADEPPQAAPTASLRPPARRPEAPRPQQTETDTASTPSTTQTQPTADAAPSSAAADVPQGPPLTSGEKDALRLAVQSCWTVDPGARWSGVKVTIAMDMGQDGKVQQGSLRLIASEGGETSTVNAAFQAARRAILRCQKGGYQLPAEKYGRWKEIEMTFNPEKMRIR